jgi:hypothetical protein
VLAGKRISSGALAAVAVGAALAGCGGGGGTTPSTPASGGPLSKQELIAQGDAICQHAREEFQQLQQNPPKSAEDAAALTQKLIDITETEVTQLRALTPPDSLESSMDAYLKALDKNVGVLKQGLKAAQQGDATAYAAAQAKTVSQQVDRLQLARAVGFKECSLPAGTAPSASGG